MSVLTNQETADMCQLVQELEDRALQCDIFTLAQLARSSGEDWEFLVRTLLQQWHGSASQPGDA